MDIYAEVTSRIIAEMEKGIIPWEKPWIASGNCVSHATGKAKLVPPMAFAAAAAGADGLMIEVHNNPACALCDGAQSLTPAQFEDLNKRVQQIREVVK